MFLKWDSRCSVKCQADSGSSTPIFPLLDKPALMNPVCPIGENAPFLQGEGVLRSPKDSLVPACHFVTHMLWLVHHPFWLLSAEKGLPAALR